MTRSIVSKGARIGARGRHLRRRMDRRQRERNKTPMRRSASSASRRHGEGRRTGRRAGSREQARHVDQRHPDAPRRAPEERRYAEAGEGAARRLIPSYHHTPEGNSHAQGVQRVRDEGNVVDLAVGVVIGAAFGKIVDSLVKDLLMPPIGLLLGGVDFSSLFIILGGRHLPDAQGGPGRRARRRSTIGALHERGDQFLIIAFAHLRGGEGHQPDEAGGGRAPPPPATSKLCAQCQMEIPIKAMKCGHCTSPVT